MADITVGIIMHGITGRMGRIQHLERSIVEILKDGGVKLENGDRIIPDPILVGRNEEKLRKLAREYSVERWTTDLDKALENDNDTIFFDAGMTNMRADILLKAINRNKHIYCEKPVADSLNDAVKVYAEAERTGVKHGVVQDKLYLPGLMKLKMLRDSGFFGEILSIKCDFGYWVFDGQKIPSQRPSWNYKAGEGGGIILDMLCHWRYIIDNIFYPVRAVSCIGATHLRKRLDEFGNEYIPDADDAAYATFQLDNNIIAQFNSSWCTRVRRDDLVTFQVDGSHGSAVAGLHKCHIQPLAATPNCVWDPDTPRSTDYHAQWLEVPTSHSYKNAFKLQWEGFLKHVAAGDSWSHDLLEGAKGLQLAEAAQQSWKERRWIDLAPIEV